MPRRGTERTKPSRSSCAIASRTGVRLMPKSCASWRSSSRMSCAAAIDVHRHDDVLQRRIGLVLEAERGVDRLDREPRGAARRRRIAVRAGRGATHGTVVDSSSGIQYSSGSRRCNAVSIAARIGHRRSGRSPPQCVAGRGRSRVQRVLRSAARTARSGRAP